MTKACTTEEEISNSSGVLSCTVIVVIGIYLFLLNTIRIKEKEETNRPYLRQLLLLTMK